METELKRRDRLAKVKRDNSIRCAQAWVVKRMKKEAREDEKEKEEKEEEDEKEEGEE